ncbi:helix-turn-helix transcriptional regulator [Ruficoccus amylovorans]|uniref:Helix-turn-helix transcriptional regulator n=1 Tax=Ruficoccus amylovorans TaxID=1804625 RepID=A0A842HCR8_9BACT|nr:AraC family transcriptional regulator [Ruficoccus amylovorans]MBC2593191.1 helix-turn-helix transcriptional regulator [Ruficoccus amylovorans]
MTIASPQWSWTSGPLRDYDLVILKSGRATYTGDEKEWQVSAGSCMLLRRGESYRGIQRQDDPVSMYFIHFDFLDRKKRPVELPEEKLLPRHFKAEHTEFVGGLAGRVLEASRGPGEPSAEATFWLRALLVELYRQARRPRWQGLEREQALRVETLCSEIRERIGEPWRLVEIAARLGCGPEHAGRLFRKYKGMAPVEFVVQARMEAAKALLSSSSLSIGQIAETLGFCDVYALSRQFKKKTGQSPRAFRHG